jgi:hypothetical protein
MIDRFAGRLGAVRLIPAFYFSLRRITGTSPTKSQQSRSQKHHASGFRHG